MTARNLRDDAGLTLIEVVITLLILSIIMGPIAAVTIIGLKTWTSSAATLSVSHDRQLLETYFGRDAASATAATLGKTGTCYTAGASAITMTSKGQRQQDGSWASSYEADYAVVQVGTLPALVRYLCTNGGTPVTLTVAHSLKTTGTAVTATCTPAPSNGICPLGTVASPVTLSVTVTDAAGVTYTLAAEQRAQG
jgi:prepilin-type N-terminal cleavage/methylation domain-containing protein